MKHTPGPWKLVSGEKSNGFENSRFLGSITGAFGYHIAAIWNDLGASQSPEANAKLIAAAPELFEACQEFVRKVEAGEAKSKKSYAQMKAIIEKLK